jgi:multidrug resistance efflux pump
MARRWPAGSHRLTFGWMVTMKPMRKVFSLTAMTLMLALASGCGDEAARAPNEAKVPASKASKAQANYDPASKLTVAVTDITDLKPVAGRYTTSDEAVARARVGGTLVRLSVTEGSFVRAGQVIGVIDEARMRAEIAARQAGASAAGSSADVGRYNTQAAQAEIARARSLAAQAPAALEQARAAQARAQADFNRTKLLYDQGVYAKARLDQMEASRRVADAQVNAALAGVSAAHQGINTAQAQAAVAAANARAGQAQANAARAQTGIATAMRAEGRIVAPRTGRVTSVPTTQGSVLMPGEAIAVIAGGAPVLKLIVPETDARRLRIGQLLALTDEAGNVTEQAAIAKIYPSVMNGQIEVDLLSDGPEERFVGQATSVLLPVGSRQAIAIPLAYLRTRAGVDYARIVRRGQALEVPIQRGTTGSSGVEILSGLVAGDVIVAYPQVEAKQ